MKKKNNYPKNRKPAKEIPCPYCSEFFAARGLHRHILIVHQINITKVTQVIPPVITKEIEVIPPTITKVIPSNSSNVSNPSNNDNLSNSKPLDEGSRVTPPKKLLYEKRESKWYKSFEECMPFVIEETPKFLKELGIDYCFGRADLREELKSICIKKREINIKCYTGQYELTAGIYYGSLTSKTYQALIIVREIKQEYNI